MIMLISRYWISHELLYLSMCKCIKNFRLFQTFVEKKKKKDNSILNRSSQAVIRMATALDE